MRNAYIIQEKKIQKEKVVLPESSIWQVTDHFFYKQPRGLM